MAANSTHQSEQSETIYSLSQHTKSLLNDMEDNLSAGHIPLDIFNNEEIYKLELEKIFGSCWVYMGHESEIPDEGDYAIRYIGEDPFIFVRDENGEVRLLFDSCTHRGSKLCRTDQGNTSHFRCPYHGWTFKNTGELVGVAEKHKSYPEMDAEDYALHEPPHVESYAGFVFASIDPDAPPLSEYLGDATWYLDPHFKMIDWEVIGEPQRWTVNIDWKTVAENASADSYHVPIGHKSATETGIGSSGQGSIGGMDASLMGGQCGNLTYGIHRVLEDADVFWGYPDEVIEGFDTEPISNEQLSELARPALSSIHNIFPNLSFNHTRSSNRTNEKPTGTCKIRQFQPKGPGKIEIWFWVLVPANASEEFKEKAYEIGMGTNGVSGNFFVDDLSILEGISESGGTVFAKRNQIATDHTMGVNNPSETTTMNDWPGPGIAYKKGAYTDANNLNFYKNWYNCLREEVENEVRYD
jgi:phenylpropionate dioxygenase-like ring-hydroxylating dioxygenase large terminal subunit